MGEIDRKLYVFDLSPLTGLGRHSPYYHAIGQVVNNVLGLNKCYQNGYFDDQLKITIADTCAEVLKDNLYATDKQTNHIEQMCFKILKRIHRLDDNIVTGCKHTVKQNTIYIEVQKWM